MHSEKLIFDVGLHRGEDTAYYLARGFNVVAIEADPDLVANCESRFEAEIKSKQLVLVNGAVIEDDEVKTVTFYKNKKVSVWGTVSPKWAERNAKLGAESIEITVPVVNFSDLFKRYGTPYYLKIDIEGMDLICLRKLVSLEGRPKYVSLESEKVDFEILKMEFDTFQELGYHKFNIAQQVYVTNQSVPNVTSEGMYVDYRFEEGSSGLFGSDLQGEWVDQEQAITKYRKIFSDYKWYGDNSLIRNAPMGRYLLAVMQRLTGRAFPGWYDTHAMIE